MSLYVNCSGQLRINTQFDLSVTVCWKGPSVVWRHVMKNWRRKLARKNAPIYLNNIENQMHQLCDRSRCISWVSGHTAESARLLRDFNCHKLFFFHRLPSLCCHFVGQVCYRCEFFLNCKLFCLKSPLDLAHWIYSSLGVSINPLQGIGPL